jgi:glycosyltransferase involved in cell wall biosynthesis
MRIGIDARPLSVARAGIARVVENVVQELVEQDGSNTYYLYSNRDFQVPCGSAHLRKRVCSRYRFLPGTLWLETGAKTIIRSDDIDVFWGTEHVLPLGLPCSVRKLLTVHDLVRHRHPQTMKAYNRLVSRLLFERSVREADRIVAVSHSTRHDLLNTLDIPEEKVRVIYNGVAPLYAPIDAEYAATMIAEKYGVSRSYVCTVGTVEPRKNIGVLVEATRILRDLSPDSLQLLIAGRAGWRNSKVYEMVEQNRLHEQVRFLGYVPDEDLRALYAGAVASVFSSMYEGFGLSLAEAMACGSPVIASDIPVFREIAGGAGILVDAHSPAKFAHATARIQSDAGLRRELIGKGLERARAFRWDTAAREMLNLFEEVSSSGA